MNPLKAWQPIALIEQAAGLAALGGLWYWWLGIAESTTGRLALSIAVLLAMMAGLWVLIKRGRARLVDASQPGAAAGQGLAALLLLAISFAAAYYLIWWVPEVSGLRSQMASVVLRFGAAFALVVTFWANLLASLGSKTAPQA